MSLPGIFDRTINVLSKVLDLRTRNQQVISSNLANIDTPGFKASRLTFEDDLRRAIAEPEGSTPKSHPGHFPINSHSLDGITGKIIQTNNQSGLGDKNGVDLDQEMIAQAENQILYETATQMLNKKLGLLKYVSQGGR